MFYYVFKLRKVAASERCFPGKNKDPLQRHSAPLSLLCVLPYDMPFFLQHLQDRVSWCLLEEGAVLCLPLLHRDRPFTCV